MGKSCLLQRLQGGAFTEKYIPTEQIQVAPIHWTYKNTDYIVKVCLTVATICRYSTILTYILILLKMFKSSIRTLT